MGSAEVATQPTNMAARILYDAMMADPSSDAFKVLPDPFLYPEYYTCIARPVAIADMLYYINHGRYTLTDMARDVRRMLANAKQYNDSHARIYQDAIALERVVRRVCKELEKEGADSDEDATCVQSCMTLSCSPSVAVFALLVAHLTFYQSVTACATNSFMLCRYARTNRDRSWYEHTERDNARQWIATQQKRAAAAALRAGKPTAEQVELDGQFVDFVKDGDLFRRGVENPVVFHQRKLGRMRSSGGAGASKGKGGAASTAAASSAAALGDSNSNATGRKRARPEDDGLLPLNAAYPPPTALPPGAGDAPGSIGAPIAQTARDAYLAYCRSKGMDVGADSDDSSSEEEVGRRRRLDGIFTSSKIGKAVLSMSAAQGADLDGSDVFSRWRVGGVLAQPPLPAHVGAYLSAPPRGTHKLLCRLCAPSLLQGVTYGRKGIDEGGGRLGATKHHKPAVMVPRFRELSTLHLQGIRYDAPFETAMAASAAAAAAAGASGKQQPAAGFSARSGATGSARLSVAEAISSPVRGGSSKLPSVQSPAVIIGLDGYSADSRSRAAAGRGRSARVGASAAPPKGRAKAVYARLSKLSRELGVPLAVDPALLSRGSRPTATAVEPSASAGRAGAARVVGRGGKRAAPSRAHMEDSGGEADEEAGSGEDEEEVEESGHRGAAGRDSRRGGLSRRGGAAVAGAAVKSSTRSRSAATAASARRTGRFGRIEQADAEEELEEGDADEDDADADTAAGTDASDVEAEEEDDDEEDDDDENDDDDDEEEEDDDDDDEDENDDESDSENGLSAYESGWEGSDALASSISGGAGASMQPLTPDPSLDAGGYNADISSAFWTNFVGKKADINAHPDGIVNLSRVAARLAKAGRTLESLAAETGVRLPKETAAATPWAAVAASSAAAGGSTSGVVGTGTSGWAASAEAAAPPAPPSLETVAVNAFPFEKWLIRRRLHYCETHGSDAPDINPVVREFSAPAASLLLHVLGRVPPEREEADAEAAAEAAALPVTAGLMSAPSFPGVPGGYFQPWRRGRARAYPATPTSRIAASNQAVAISLLQGASLAAAAAVIRADSPTNGPPIGKKRKLDKRGRPPGRGKAGGRQAAPTAGPKKFLPTMLGAQLDVRDSSGQWWLAQVVDVETVPPPKDPSAPRPLPASHPVRRMQVHYYGWPEEYDEWIEAPTPAVIAALNNPAEPQAPAVRAALASLRIAPPMTHSALVSNRCAVCSNTKAGQLLFCDAEGCGRAYHMQCVKPKLTKVPTGAWYCNEHSR